MLNRQKLQLCSIRLGQRSGISILCLLPPGAYSAAAEYLQKGEVQVKLSFDRGVSWPDRHGLMLLAEAIDERLVASLADAMLCNSRLRRMMEGL